MKGVNKEENGTKYKIFESMVQKKKCVWIDMPHITNHISANNSMYFVLG